MANYTVTDKVLISAPKSKVWEVLTHTQYIKQWDDVPKTFTEDKIYMGAALHWEGHAKMTVTVFKEEEQLTQNLFLPKVDLPAEKYNVNYTYRLSENNGQTELEFEIGDFTPLP